MAPIEVDPRGNGKILVRFGRKTYRLDSTNARLLAKRLEAAAEVCEFRRKVGV